MNKILSSYTVSALVGFLRKNMAVEASTSTVTEHFAVVSINWQTHKHGSHDELTMFTVCVTCMSVRGFFFLKRGCCLGALNV